MSTLTDTMQTSHVERLAEQAHRLTLGLSPDSDRGAVIEAYSACEDLLAAVKELRRTCKEIVRQWVEERGDLVWAPNPEDLTTAIRLRNAPDNTVKCVLTPDEMVDLVLQESGGDLGALGRLLSSSNSTWKQGELRELLGDDAWSKAFRRESGQKLVKGKPTKSQSKLLKERYSYASKRAREEIAAEIERQKAEQ